MVMDNYSLSCSIEEICEEMHIDKRIGVTGDELPIVEKLPCPYRGPDNLFANNKEFVGKVHGLSDFYHVFNWVEECTGEDRNSSLDVPVLNINEISSKHIFKRVLLNDCIISFADTPRDRVVQLDVCPKCGCSNPTTGTFKYLRPDGSEFYSEETYCENCSEIDYFSTEKADNRFTSNSRIVRLLQTEFKVKLQRVIVTDPKKTYTVAMYITSNEPLFSQRDVGSHWTFEGFLKRDVDPTETCDYMMVAPNALHWIFEDFYENLEEKVPTTTTRDDVSPEWRKDILARDKHCIICGGEKHLEAHHIFGYKGHPDLRDNIDNGITLCRFCHQNYHSQYGVKNPNPVTLVKFVQQFR